MAIRPFLAMTAAELRCSAFPPPEIAWMACHFSPYGLGISNLPAELPKGSLLILDDITPFHGHDPQVIAQQLQQQVTALECCGVLLDFQRKENEAVSGLAEYLVQSLPCPTAVSDLYCGNLSCPVFVPPAAPSASLREHLQPWQGREIWLEIGSEAQAITLTDTGAAVSALPRFHPEAEGFADEALHCHYRAELQEDAAVFTLWRTQEDLKQLLAEAQTMGIKTAVGLYQQLRHFTGLYNP